MKLTFKFWILSLFLAYAQAPVGYYNSATGTGYTLKTQLHQILINTHNPQAYSTHWTFFEAADVLPNGKVWDIYANCNFNFGVPANGGNQDVGIGGNVECEYFNREHTFPTSWFGNIEPVRSDIVHIFPADKKVNNERGNLPFANVGTISYTSTNNSKRGNSNTAGITGQVFEVAPEFKGDIARAFFYMATRYQDIVSGWQTLNSDGDKMLDGSANKVFEQWALDLLFSWHINDPVSTKEINRNNLAFNYQGNRNPFVDNPHWVETIWGNVLSNYTSSNTLQAIAYPNPSWNGNFTIESSNTIDEIKIVNLQGQLLMTIHQPSPTNNHNYVLEQIPSGIWLVQMFGNTGQKNLKLIVP